MSTATMPGYESRLGRLLRRSPSPRDPEVVSRKQRWLRIGLIAGMVTAILAGMLLIFAVSAHADPEKNNYSLYKLASSTSAYFGNTQSPDNPTGGGKLGEGWAVMTNNASNAGGFLGYPDNQSNTILKWLSSQISGSSVTYNYDSFQDGKIVVEGASGSNTAMLNYAYFGASLSALGLDSTSTALSLPIARVIGGSIMLAAFGMVGFVDAFFWIFVAAMKLLNPFTIFFNGIKAVNPKLAATFGGYETPATVEVFGVAIAHPFYGLASFVGGWYAQLVDLAWLMVPLFLGVLIFTLLMFRRSGQTGGKVKKFMIRLVFITIGIPLLGGMYTGTLDAMMKNMGPQPGRMGASKVVLSTYVDFDRWAMNNRLAVPTTREGYPCTAKITWVGSRSEPDGAARAALRNTALCINNQTGAYGDLGQIASTASGDNGGSVAGNWNRDNETGLNSSGTIQNTVSLLLRYIGAQQVSSSDFETGVKAQLTSDMNNGTVSRKAAQRWFLDYSKDTLEKAKPGDDITKEDAGGDPSGNPVLVIPQGKGLIVDVTNYPDFRTTQGSTIQCGYQIVGAGRDCNMSAMSMYNYLNTSFGPRSMTVYSSEKASSGAIREQHNAVNQIGTGLMSFLYWFNSVTMLLVYALLGFWYAIGMLVQNLIRGIKLVMAVPFSMLGAVNSITKVIVYTIAMVVEVIGTVFVYSIMQEIILSLPQIVEAPIAAAFSSGGSTFAVGAAAALLSGGWLSMVILIVSTVFLIWFAVMALKIRKSFVSGVNEAVTKTIERFTDGNFAPAPKGPGALGAMAGAGAAGLGMAAAGRALGGGGVPGMGARGGKGPGKVTTGGGSPMGAKQAAIGPGLAGGAFGPGPDGGPGGSGPGGGGDDSGPDGGPLAITAGSADGGAGADGQGGSGGDGASAVDENGRPIDVDDTGSPIVASGEAPGASSAVAGSDDSDRNTAAAVEARGGLSTGDDARPGIGSSEATASDSVVGGVAAQGPKAPIAAEAADPNTSASTANEISTAKEEARKDQVMGGGKAVVGVGEAALGAKSGNVDMAQDGVQRAADGVKSVQAGQDRVRAAESQVGADGPAGGQSSGSGGSSSTGSTGSGGESGSSSTSRGPSTGEAPRPGATPAPGVPTQGGPGGPSGVGAAGAAMAGAAAVSGAGRGPATGGQPGARPNGTPGQPSGGTRSLQGGGQSGTRPQSGGQTGGAPQPRGGQAGGAPQPRGTGGQPGGRSGPAVQGQGSRPGSQPGARPQGGPSNQPTNRPAPRASRPAPAQSGNRPSQPMARPGQTRTSNTTNVTANVGGSRVTQAKNVVNKGLPAVRSFVNSPQGRRTADMVALSALQAQQQRRAEKKAKRRRKA